MQSGLLFEKAFRMAKSDLQARPIYHRKRNSIEAHLTSVFAAMAVSRWIEQQTGWSIRRFVKTARRYRTIQIQATGATVRNVPCVGLPFIYGGQPWGLPLPRVVRLLDDLAPDVVHAVCPMLLGWAGVLHAERRRLPLVCSYHTHATRYALYCRLGFAEGLV